MIICSCNVISDRDIEQALLEIFATPAPLVPTPGVVFRQLAKRMNCCGCAPLAVETIYRQVDRLQREGRICPRAGANAKRRLARMDSRRLERVRPAVLLEPAE